MKLIEKINGSLIYLYNNGTAVTIDVLTGEDIKFFTNYMDAYMWSLPF